MPLVALCSFYVAHQKLLNFIDAFDCYKQKLKLDRFNLAHPVDVDVSETGANLVPVG